MQNKKLRIQVKNLWLKFRSILFSYSFSHWQLEIWNPSVGVRVGNYESSEKLWAFFYNINIKFSIWLDDNLSRA